MAMLYKEYDEAEVTEMMRRDAKEEGWIEDLDVCREKREMC